MGLCMEFSTVGKSTYCHTQFSNHFMRPAYARLFPQKWVMNVHLTKVPESVLGNVWIHRTWHVALCAISLVALKMLLWVCDMRVTSRQDVVSNGLLVQQNPTVIGTPIVCNIRLNIIGKCFIREVHHGLRSLGNSTERLCFELWLVKYM